MSSFYHRSGVVFIYLFFILNNCEEKGFKPLISPLEILLALVLLFLLCFPVDHCQKSKSPYDQGIINPFFFKERDKKL